MLFCVWCLNAELFVLVPSLWPAQFSLTFLLAVLGPAQLKLGGTGPLCCLLLACPPSTQSLQLYPSPAVSHAPALHRCAGAEVAEQYDFPSLAQPGQEPHVAAVSVGPCTLHAGGHSEEEDRVPPALGLLEPVAQSSAGWAILAPLLRRAKGHVCPSGAGEVP